MRLPEQDKLRPSMPIMVCWIRRFLVGLRCLRWAQCGLIQLCKPPVGGFVSAQSYSHYLAVLYKLADVALHPLMQHE
jgi:hypothetical protein